MKQFLGYFKIPFIIIAVLAIICIGVRAVKGSDVQTYVWANTETDLNKNVFNYANNLSDDRVAELEKIISEVEDQIGCDIAVITLNETLSYKGYDSQPAQWVMEYADDFADQHMMGYDKAHGDSIVFIDNLYREDTGRVYSWISTSGRAMSTLTQSDCEGIMDEALYYLDDYSESDDYFDAYSKVVQMLPRYFKSSAGMLANYLKPLYIILAALIISVIYILINWSSTAGEKTTNSNTYVKNGKPLLKKRADLFLRKTVSKRKIETNSGSGGSGGHISSGGFSHGGGGHSR